MHYYHCWLDPNPVAKEAERDLLALEERSKPAKRQYISRLEGLYAEQHLELPSKVSSLATQFVRVKHCSHPKDVQILKPWELVGKGLDVQQ